LGAAPGPPGGPRRMGNERAVAYVTAATQQIFAGQDATEALSLARLACQTPSGDDAVLNLVDDLVAWTQEAQTQPRPATRWPRAYPLLAAQLLAGTPAAGA
ncbi:MAG: hypothetical protein M3296_09660, partial [Actinomycetota bacterium]|nr:hypothetical protein [Actinomycetota bacterium]